MPAVLVNTLAIVLGSGIGVLLKKGFPEKVEKAVMTGLGLCVLLIGIQGALKTENILIVILSVVLGAICGTLPDIDRALNRLGNFIEGKIKGGSSESTLAAGMVSGSLLFCIGAMTVVGSFNAGLRGDYTMLFTKSLLDFFAAIVLSVSLGIGVALSAVPVLIIQGAIALLAGVLEPILSATAITEIGAVGSVLIMPIGLNLAGITKIKVANYLPAIIFAPLLVWAFGAMNFLTLG